MGITHVSTPGEAPLTSILTPPRGGFPNTRALARFVLSAIMEIKRGGYNVRFYVTEDMAAAIRPALERLGIKLLPARELKPPYVLFRLEGGEVVVEASDGEDVFVVGRASFYEFVGQLYDLLLERLCPRRRSTHEGDDETGRGVLYLDDYAGVAAEGPRGGDKR